MTLSNQRGERQLPDEMRHQGQQVCVLVLFVRAVTCARRCVRANRGPALSRIMAVSFLCLSSVLCAGIFLCACVHLGRTTLACALVHVRTLVKTKQRLHAKHFFGHRPQSIVEWP